MFSAVKVWLWWALTVPQISPVIGSAYGPWAWNGDARPARRQGGSWCVVTHKTWLGTGLRHVAPDIASLFLLFLHRFSARGLFRMSSLRAIVSQAMRLQQLPYWGFNFRESWGCSGRDLEITGLHQQLAALLMLKAAAMGSKKCVPCDLGVKVMFIESLIMTIWGTKVGVTSPLVIHHHKSPCLPLHNFWVTIFCIRKWLASDTWLGTSTAARRERPSKTQQVADATEFLGFPGCLELRKPGTSSEDQGQGAGPRLWGYIFSIYNQIMIYTTG